MLTNAARTATQDYEVLYYITDDVVTETGAAKQQLIRHGA